MSEKSDTDVKEHLEEDSVSSVKGDQSSSQEASATATSQPESRAGKFSSKIKHYSTDELKLCDEGNSVIGSGGFGMVRKYCHNDKIVAIKEFAFKGNDETITEIWNTVRREANILSRFRHENIVEILGITQWPKRVGIIMEYLNGGNLQHLLSADNQTALSWITRLEIARGISLGLNYIHNYGENKIFCHGDLKPANVLLTQSLQVKLADFGSAAFHRATSASTTTIGHVSTTQFTLIYVAPEFLEDSTRERSPAMDMYSFGLVLYELISRKAPYSDSAMPSIVPGLILAKIKPSGKLIDEAEKQLESDDDRDAFSLLKKLMQRCSSSDSALRPSSEAAKMELSTYLTNQRHDSHDASAPNHGTEEVQDEGNEKESAAAPSEGGASNEVDDSTSFSPLLFSGADQPSTSFDIVLPKKISSREEVQETAFKTLLEIADSSMFLENNASVQGFLAKYTDSLLNKDFKQADTFRAALRSFIVNEVNPEAKEVKKLADKLLKEEKYLQSIGIFDAAAALFAKLKNPEEDLEKIQFCIQGMKHVNKKMINEDANIKVIVKEHVIPLMRHWMNEIKGASQVSEKWRCHVLSWALSNIENCELYVDQWEARKQTLEEAISGMRRVFGPDVHKLHGRLFGALLTNLGVTYKRASRLEEAAILFKESVAAHKAALDYFGDNKERKKDIDTSEKHLKRSLKEAWEKQLQMK